MSAGPVTSGVVIVQSDAAYTATPMPQLRISAYHTAPRTKAVEQMGESDKSSQCIRVSIQTL
jgi:hypothetical protein